MSKTLCELDKLRQKDFAAYVALVDQPAFVCQKCGRAANKKNRVCEPRKIKRQKEERGSHE
jgi:hypothetical protein